MTGFPPNVSTRFQHRSCLGTGGFLLGFLMIAIAVFSDDMRRQAFDYYAGHPSVTLGAIATFLGLTRHAFLRLRREWSWPPRTEAIASALRGEPANTNIPASQGVGRTGLREAAAALAQVTRSRLDVLINDQNAAADIDHDRTARTLAAYAKTLTIAQSLLEQEGSTLDDAEADEHPPRSIGELRDELARHLERIVAEEEAVGSDGILV